ncbi:MAG: DUF302 domain-containing protein [Bacteroidota bacterium]|nr:DUF302 domain-containing protein [Bacteroidota bacterium]
MEINRWTFIKQITGCAFLAFFPVSQNMIMNTQGIIIRTSPYGVKETIDRLVIFLEKHGSTVYSRINQQNEVRHTGREIPPVEFILFGNPAKGGAIMAANPLAALDLPLKILAWETEDEVVKVAFNDPAYIKYRYSLPAKLTASLDIGPLLEKALA